MNDLLFLKAKGRAFTNEKYDLRKLEHILTNYRIIIDKIIPTLLHQKSLPPNIRKDLIYQVDIKAGSLEVILEFIQENPETIALFALDGGITLAQLISKLFNAIVELRRIFSTFLSKNKTPTIRIDQNMKGKSVNSNYNISEITINNPQIWVGAQATKSSLDRLINGVDGNSIESLNINNGDNFTKITTDDRKITGTQKEELGNTLQLAGRLDTVAFTAHRGTIVTQDRRFPVIWDENIRAKIQEIVDIEGIRFQVRPIIDKRIFKEDPVGFHLISCEAPQIKIK